VSSVLKAHLSVLLDHIGAVIEVGLVRLSQCTVDLATPVVAELHVAVVQLLVFEAKPSLALFVVHHESLVVGVLVIVSDVCRIVAMNEVLRWSQQRRLSVIIALNVPQLGKQVTG
jgi:hypothetical protein